MRKIFVFILMGFALVMNHQISAKEKTGKEYLVYVDEIIHSFEQEIAEKYGFVATGSGGRMSHDVDEISVSFIVFQRATIEQARELEVALTEKLLKKVNEHKLIRPFLREFPFTHKGIDIMISFRNLENRHNIDGSVALVFQAKSKLFYYDAYEKYCNIRAENVTSLSKDPIYEEPYEEAYKIVMGEKKKEEEL